MTTQKHTPETLASSMAVSVRDLEQLPGMIYEKAMAAYEDRAEMAEALRDIADISDGGKGHDDVMAHALDAITAKTRAILAKIDGDA